MCALKERPLRIVINLDRFALSKSEKETLKISSKSKIRRYGDKVLVKFDQTFDKRTTIGTKNTVLMSELLPNENGFKRKNSQMLKFYQNPKLPYYILVIFKPKYISKLP